MTRVKGKRSLSGIFILVQIIFLVTICWRESISY